MNDNNIRRLYEEVCKNYEEEYRIILEPGRNFTEEWIEYDTVKWEIEDIIKDKIAELKNNVDLNFEEKILELYKYIGLKYIYDDNVLFFFKKDCSDPENIKYIAVDFYGRIIDEVWKANRKKHNRRVCYEFARFFAKAINELRDENSTAEACMLGLNDNTHYIVGLTSDEYSLALDIDDFNKIKDLTRLKLGLTIEGIKILRDEKDIFTTLINKYNKDKLEDLKESIIAKEEFLKGDIILYLNKIISILKTYNLDSQGFMEYMKAKISELEIDTDRIWKKVTDVPEKTHVRCLSFDYNNKKYLLDTVNQSLKEVNLDELDESIFIVNPEEKEYKYYGG